MAKVSSMQVRNVWVIIGQRVKIVTKELSKGDWDWDLSGHFNSTSHQTYFLFFHFTIWDLFKGSIFADISQVEMTKVMVRWRLSVNQTSSKCKGHLLYDYVASRVLLCDSALRAVTLLNRSHKYSSITLALGFGKCTNFYIKISLK